MESKGEAGKAMSVVCVFVCLCVFSCCCVKFSFNPSVWLRYFPHRRLAFRKICFSSKRSADNTFKLLNNSLTEEIYLTFFPSYVFFFFFTYFLNFLNLLIFHCLCIHICMYFFLCNA